MRQLLGLAALRGHHPQIAQRGKGDPLAIGRERGSIPSTRRGSVEEIAFGADVLGLRRLQTGGEGHGGHLAPLRPRISPSEM
jgi:hypothetical protein